MRDRGQCVREREVSPFHRAQIVYTQESCKRDFWTDLHLHLTQGFVFSTPDAFIMGRPVDRHAESWMVVNPAIEFENPDAWLIYLAATSDETKSPLETFLKYEPYPLPWYGWERNNVLRFYERGRIIRKLK